MRTIKFDENGNKICPACGEGKPREAYYTTKGKASSRCKNCTDEYNKEWQLANPEKYRASRENWRRENEGHTYKTPAGYVKFVGYEHPVANPSGITQYHRVVLFDKIGPGEHKCYWGCGRVLSWEKKYPQSLDALVVDHLNGVRDDNRPENLVPSCAPCNSSVSRLSRAKPKGDCSFEGCGRVEHTNGLCKTHYMQDYLGKELKPIRKVVRIVPDATGRICTECDEWKTFDFFSKNSTGNYRSKCRKCLSDLATKRRNEKLAQAEKCSVDDCTTPALNKGLCQRHYQRDYYRRLKEAV